MGGASGYPRPTMSEPTIPDFIEELRWRGLLHQCTDEDALREHLKTPGRKAYIGFDPTADSLTIGNLVPIMMLAHFQRAGHTPIPLMGGGTGLIGDPSGKSAERQLRTEDEINANVAAQSVVFNRVFSDANGLRPVEVKNNLEWLKGLSYIEALRDVGKHFSVNMMMQKDSVRERLNNREQGISYTEFSYMILQSYDYSVLNRDHGITLQMGGSDQWGNIVAGTDLVRRMSEGSTAFGLTAPLVTKADGGKFGKTEAGAIWLTPERTSPYAFYQWCINTADDDVIRFLKLFTLLSKDEIDAIEAEHNEAPGKRFAQTRLAEEFVRFLHGASALAGAQAASKALFSGDVSGLDEQTLREVFAETPSTEFPHARLAGDGLAIMDALTETGLAKSNREAKEFLAGGSVSVNGAKCDAERNLTPADLLPGGVILLRRGKKAWHVARFG